jgi:hypothetical protein
MLQDAKVVSLMMLWSFNRFELFMVIFIWCILHPCLTNMEFPCQECDTPGEMDTTKSRPNVYFTNIQFSEASFARNRWVPQQYLRAISEIEDVVSVHNHEAHFQI